MPWPARRSVAWSASCAARSPSWSGRWGARRMSSRSREKHWRPGSERARRFVPGACCRGVRPSDGGARHADQPSGALLRPEAAHAVAAPPAGLGLGRRRDRRGREGEPDRRLPDRHGLGRAQARRRREPQAGAARDARAEADPASRPRAQASAARVLPGRAARPALASGHDERLGRRARLGLPETRSSTAAPARSSAGRSACAAAPPRRSQ